MNLVTHDFVSWDREAFGLPTDLVLGSAARRKGWPPVPADIVAEVEAALNRGVSRISLHLHDGVEYSVTAAVVVKSTCT